ncbi:MAG: branched-chain-amino-acid transaminase [bacterium]
MVIFLNGKFLKQEEAKVSAFDRGFLYGDGLFETIRFYSGEPFAWKEHMRRLQKALKQMRVAIPYKDDDLLSFCKKVIESNGLQNKDAYLRITVTRGVNTALRDFSSSMPTVFIFTREIDIDLLKKRSLEGITGITVPFCRGDFASLKHIGYLPSLFAFMETGDSDVEPIFTSGGKILEGATSNIFFVKRGSVITPKKGILKGVIRELLIKSLKRRSVKVEERDVFLKEVKEFSGCFITNSIIEVLPLVKLNNINFNTEEVRDLFCLIEEIKRAGLK